MRGRGSYYYCCCYYSHVCLFFGCCGFREKRSQVFAQRLHSRGLAWECDLWLKTLDSSNDFEPSNENLQKCMVCEFHSTNSFKNH